jgi:hypothetical protein
MTDIARKREYAAITKDSRPAKAIKAIKAKKVKQEVAAPVPAEKREEEDNDGYAFDGTLSINTIAATQPGCLKKVLD